ncbi:hypothetical protein HK104_001629 [Borealophlyctis nickersoniae]|nr:hypothetical protein HK104_001629 [Borealophlyctis nickersoniae]
MITEHPLFNLTITVAIGLACTIATGVAVTYGFQHLIRDHNISALRKEFKREQRKFREQLKSIEDEVVGAIAGQLKMVGHAIRDPKETESTGTGVVSVEGDGAAGSSIPGIPTAGIASSRRSQSSPSPQLDERRRTRSRSGSPSISIPPIPPVDPSNVDRRLREIDDQLVRLLERLDALHPRSILPSGILSLEIRDSGTWGDIDSATWDIMAKGVEAARARKKIVVNKVQGRLEEVDGLCDLAGLPSVGLQHRSWRATGSKAGIRPAA